MKVKIIVPTPLRPFVENKEEIFVYDVRDIKSALKSFLSQNSELQKRLFDDQNNLRRFVNIYLNNKDIRYQSGLSTPLQDADVISIVPAIAGGANG